MNRRTFLATTLGTAGALPLAAQNYSDYTKDPRHAHAEDDQTRRHRVGWREVKSLNHPLTN